MISAAFADNREKWPESMTDYYITKYYADEWLKNQTSLDYVILQPVALTNDEEVTSIQLTKPDEKPAQSITRKTVAEVLAALVDQPNISKQLLFYLKDQLQYRMPSNNLLRRLDHAWNLYKTSRFSRCFD